MGQDSKGVEVGGRIKFLLRDSRKQLLDGAMVVEHNAGGDSGVQLGSLVVMKRTKVSFVERGRAASFLVVVELSSPRLLDRPSRSVRSEPPADIVLIILLYFSFHREINSNGENSGRKSEITLSWFLSSTTILGELDLRRGLSDCSSPSLSIPIYPFTVPLYFELVSSLFVFVSFSSSLPSRASLVPPFIRPLFIYKLYKLLCIAQFCSRLDSLRYHGSFPDLVRRVNGSSRRT